MRKSTMTFPSALLLLGSLLCFVRLGLSDSLFNAPSGVDTWCGKAYHPTDPAFDPGGRIERPPPTTTPDQLRLALKVYPHYSYYTSNDTTATLIVDTPVDDYSGTPFYNWTYDSTISPTEKVPLTELELYVGEGEALVLVDWIRVPVNGSGTELPISLEGLRGKQHYEFAVVGNSPDGVQSFYSTVSITILPDYDHDTATSGMTRIDHLQSSISVRSRATSWEWRHFFPVGFYADWAWIKYVVLDDEGHNALITQYFQGRNVIHPILPSDAAHFDPELFEKFLSLCDDLLLYVVLDLRHVYQNTTALQAQVNRYKNHTSILLYHTAHEPDGHSDAPGATLAAYHALKAIDAYRPVSLTLHCANYFFAAYAAGADILLEDTWTLVQSSQYSTLYDTVCNATYGRCGCDECHVNDAAYKAYVANPFKDVTDRLRSYYTYQAWMQAPPQPFTKPVWSVPQAFRVSEVDDARGLWSRDATAQEEALLWLLRVNQGSMGLLAEKWPTSDALGNVTSQLAKVLTESSVTALLTEAPRMPLPVFTGSSVSDPHLFDFAIWIGEQDVLIVLLYVGTRPLTDGPTRTELPVEVEQLEVLWGYGGWSVEESAFSLKSDSMEELEACVLKARIVEQWM